MHTHYKSKVIINPDQGTLEADCHITNLPDHHGEMVFIMHDSTAIKQINSNYNFTYELAYKKEEPIPYIAEGTRNAVRFDDPNFNPHDAFLDIDYTSTIHSVSDFNINCIAKGWVELCLYTPWFPLKEDYSASHFSTQIEFTDKNYLLVSPHDHYEKGVWHATTENPFPTQTLMASDKFHTQAFSVTSDDTTINVYYLDEKNRQSTELLSQQTREVLAYFKTTFGPIPSQKESVVVVPRGNGTSGGGYNRPGLVIMPDIDAVAEDSNPIFASDIYAFKYLSHEIAHKWWCKASPLSWQDWLNESFAEYSCLLAVEAFISKDRFQQLITLYQDTTKDLPAIWEIERHHEKAFDVLYTKGALVLHTLRLRLGDHDFFALLRQVHTQGISITDDFLSLLSEVCGEETRNWFEDVLRK